MVSRNLEQAEHARAERNGGSGDDAFADATNVIASAASASECSVHTSTIWKMTSGLEQQGARPVSSTVEENVDSLFKRRQHQNALLELCNTKSGNSQNLNQYVITMPTNRLSKTSHLALEAHQVSQEHHVARIDFETERIAHSVLKFINDAIASSFNA
jgi:hypothetical protein